ncbi:MAG TPA: TonB-dependent receptor [Holophagaceae bacterium]|jgi:outer membrane cobalamin receptor|nr:TonB-dependent receptor [Holophagaceae bacterium]
MGASRLFHLLVIGATGASLLAADAADQPKPKATASAAVTVTAESTPVDVAKTPNPVKVITAEEIARSGARNLGELLQRELPGQVSQSGGAGSVADPQIGASRPQDTLVLLDGMRLVDASGLGTNLSEISLAGVARVEIQRGPVSTLYGSDAQGGVIALYTDAAVADGTHGDWGLSLGTHGLARLNGMDSFGWGSGNARLALSGARQDAPTEADNRFRQGSAFLGITQSIAENHSLSVIYRAAFQGTPIPYQSTDISAPFVYTPDRQATVRGQQVIGTLRSGWGADWGTEATLGYAEQSRVEPNDFAASFGGPPTYSYSSYNHQANLTLHWNPSAAFAGSFLLQGVHERAVQPDYAGGLNRAEGSHIAAAMELAWEPVESLRLVGSLREQKDKQTFVTTPAVPDTENSQTTGKLGVNWQIGGGFRAYASGGSAFSNPLLFQVLYNAGPFVNGPVLHNEKSHFLQAGLGWDQGPWHTRLEAWRTKLDQAVLFDLNNYVYYNGGNLRFQGLEGAVDYKVDHWGLGAWARSQEARDLTQAPDQQLSADAVLRRPFFAFGLQGDATWGDFRGDLGWAWQGPRYEYFGSAPNGPGRTHYNDLHASLAWSFGGNMSLTLRGDNLLQPKITAAEWKARKTDFRNDAYQVYNFPAQPPTVSLEFRIRY